MNAVTLPYAAIVLTLYCFDLDARSSAAMAATADPLIDAEPRPRRAWPGFGPLLG